MNGDTTYALNDLLALADRLEAKRHAAPDADADAFRRGTWRACTRCRGDPGDEASGVIEADSSALDAILELPYCPLNPKGPTP